jgi:UDP-N-acetylmuramate--alanine ligase
MFFKPQHLHFVGIGGIGMSGIAEVLLNLGYQISGSDLKLSPTTERLASLGATDLRRPRAPNVQGAKAIVVSSAVDAANPEVQEARRLLHPRHPARRTAGRADAPEVRHRDRRQPRQNHHDIHDGGGAECRRLRSHGGGGRASRFHGRLQRARGQSDFLVVESDESDGSFLKLSPIVAVVTNIDREHLDHYPAIVEIRAAFLEFIQKVPFYGAPSCAWTTKTSSSFFRQVNRRTITYGRSQQASLQITSIPCGAL